MRKIRILVKKEIRDILRDRKTLIIMVAVPVLLYPLMIIGMSLGISMFMQSQESKVHTVGYRAEDEALAGALEKLYAENKQEIDWDLEFVQEPGGRSVRQAAAADTEPADAESVDAAAADAEPADTGSADAEPASSDFDVRIEVKQKQDGVPHVDIYYSSGDTGSSGTRRAVEELLELYREELVVSSLQAAGMDASILQPVTYESNDSVSLSESLGMDIGGSIGMLLIVTILLGAVYPAIDATAGEKERGTLETLLTLPVSNFQMIMSKFISVSVFACVTALLSLLSLGGSVLFLIYGIAAPAAGVIQGLSAGVLLKYAPLLLVTLFATALLSTAICMCFCVFAKSFKEANNYVTPVLLIVMFAAMSAMIPTFRLDYRTALIPVVNVSLMVKELISQQLVLGLVPEVIAVNLAYSVLVVWVLAKIYDSESVLFAEGFRSFRLFQRRADMKKGTLPDTGDVILAMTVLLLLVLYGGSAVSSRTPIGGVVLNQILILLVPLAFVWYMKCDAARLFSMKAPRKGTVLGSVLLYCGTFCISIAVAFMMSRLFPQSMQNLSGTFDELLEAPTAVLLLVMAVMPAVGEEIFFRGFVFGSFRGKFPGKTAAIAASALVFAAFHMSFVKLPSTFLLGVVFAYTVSVTGSIYVTMTLHFVNNAVSVLSMQYPEKVGRILPFLVKAELSTPEFAGIFAAGAVLLLIGWRMLGKKETI